RFTQQKIQGTGHSKTRQSTTEVSASPRGQAEMAASCTLTV
uniref:Uncharacterized protein n=1 Tax=Aegilops tauschii subsp. strangulata TaxID=200361 RepID=A0A453KM17_AEGTS